MAMRVEARVLNARVRELVLGGRWAEAQRFLLSCLGGMDTDQCYRVLSGETRLVDVDDEGRPTPTAGIRVDFAADVGVSRDAEDERFSAECARRWSGVLATRWGHFVPYGWVTNYGFEDMPSEGPGTAAATRYVADARAEGRKRGSMGSLAARPAHYVDRPDDLVVDARVPDALRGDDVHETMPFLFRKIPDLPPWIDPLRDAGECVAVRVAGGWRPEERGHRQSYREDLPAVARPLRSAAIAGAGETDHVTRAEEAGRRAECESARRAILARMSEEGMGGWLDMAVGDDVLRVPEVPFLHWALDRCGAGGSLPDWTPCSRAGLKSGMEGSTADDPMHTDWMLGAGIDPVSTRWYGDGAERLVEAAYDLLAKVQRERLSFSCSVLTGSGCVTGRAYVARRGRPDLPEPGEVVVLPDASPDWLETVEAACGGGDGAVVLSRGGALAHLVVVSMERGVAVVRVDRASRTYVDGQLLAVDCDGGSVSVLPVDLERRSDPDASDDVPRGPMG